MILQRAQLAILTALVTAALGCGQELTPASRAPAAAPDRLATIRARGHLGCGIEAGVPGFSTVDATSQHRGFDIDVCRAIAAAILGNAERVAFHPAPSLGQFLQTDKIDVVSRRLTWEIRREGHTGLLFGPITFFDGQAVLVPTTSGIRRAVDLAGTPICVAGGAPFEINLTSYFAERNVPLKKDVLESAHDFDDIAARLAGGECRAYSGDLSDLAIVRSKLPRPDAFTILPDRLSDEPLAPVVRSDDARFFTIVRWTVFALIAAEELGVTASNVEDRRASANLHVRRLLGVMSGNGSALGLDEQWALHAIKAVGNYGEIFDRNVGRNSPLRLDRGLNGLRRDGGLLYAPPLR